MITKLKKNNYKKNTSRAFEKLNIIKTKYSQSIIPFFLFLFTFLVYMSNLSPTVFGGDSGDFLSAIITKGVPHPSGYPLYTILGILFNALPLGHSTAWRVGITSSLYASTGIVLMYLLCIQLTKNKWASFISSLTLAFIYPFWIYAEVTEIFSLHSLFILLISYLTVKYINEKNVGTLYFLCFFSGLSLTNNLTIILLFPGVGLSVLFTNTKILKNFRLLFRCLLAFVLGLLPYLYIPIAASSNPIVNWDRAVNMKNFLDLIFRKDYGWVYKDDTPFFPLQALSSFVTYWKVYISALVIPLSILGIAHIILDKKYKILMYLLASFLLVGPLFIIYTKTPTNSLSSIYTLERFYLPPMIFIIIFISEGLVLTKTFITSLVKNRSLHKFLSTSTIIAFSALPLSLFIQNLDKANLSNVYIGEKMAYDVLRPLEPNSFLFVVNDEFAFNTLYVQEEYGFRKDVTIPGRNTGFEKFLSTSKVVDEKSIDEYLTKNRNTINQEDLYQGIVNLIESGYSVYSTEPKLIVESKLGKLATIPNGLVYKFIEGKKSVPSEEQFLLEQENILRTFDLKEFDLNENIVDYSFTLSNIKRHYSLGYQNIANFLKLYYKDNDASKYYLEKARSLDPILSSY